MGNSATGMRRGAKHLLAIKRDAKKNKTIHIEKAANPTSTRAWS
jgi:hypothetical protein